MSYSIYGELARAATARAQCHSSGDAKTDARRRCPVRTVGKRIWSAGPCSDSKGPGDTPPNPPFVWGARDQECPVSVPTAKATAPLPWRPSQEGEGDSVRAVSDPIAKAPAPPPPAPPSQGGKGKHRRLIRMVGRLSPERTIRGVSSRNQSNQIRRRRVDLLARSGPSGSAQLYRAPHDLSARLLPGIRLILPQSSQWKWLAAEFAASAIGKQRAPACGRRQETGLRRARLAEFECARVLLGSTVLRIMLEVTTAIEFTNFRTAPHQLNGPPTPLRLCSRREGPGQLCLSTLQR
jgi:hypothetical protein